MNASIPSVSSSDVTATIGFMLTLVGLIGTFFYVHLSNWLRELLELRAKYELNSIGDDQSRVQGRLECRFQLQRLLNHVPLLIAVVLSAFIILVTHVASTLIAAAQPEPAVVPYYRTAAIYFLVAYFGLTIYMLIFGYAIGFRLRSKVNPNAHQLRNEADA